VGSDISRFEFTTDLCLSRLEFALPAYESALITTNNVTGATKNQSAVWIAVKPGPGVMPGSYVVKSKFISEEFTR
jgi:hypothetical protein